MGRESYNLSRIFLPDIIRYENIELTLFANLIPPPPLHPTLVPNKIISFVVVYFDILYIAVLFFQSCIYCFVVVQDQSTVYNGITSSNTQSLFITIYTSLIFK